MPRLQGKRALVTGGAAGVGEYVSRGLLERGAEVITLARGLSQSSGTIPGAEALSTDLADPASIITAVDSLGDMPFDLVICNAGLVLQSPESTVTGVEKTFGVNVLGHHLLYRLLIERDLLTKNARVVLTTGEAYVMAEDCSADAFFDSTQKAYARSKLGNLWQVAELKNRYPQLHPIAVHPGVVASGLGGSKTGFLARLRSLLLISEEAGAQASLIGATQDLPRGAYWHNTLGLVEFRADDPALDAKGSAHLWNQLETLAAPFLAQSERTASSTKVLRSRSC
ncbi:SDR family NAD(P)-dependent oxidoreductase [Microbulbifer sp. 2201CG32-9]|uniref:SDR family NAD(P)-dependent oxidoreductase n=1 Tax=Microbulbifer sp. 2201CG32-9 TaxID=3232309 RepID=UPI00345BBF33